MDCKPGDQIRIEIDGKELSAKLRITTTIDPDGVQRLPINTLYRSLIDSEVLSLNNLAVAYFNDEISFLDYLEFYLNIGYSVCGFAELSAFEGLTISNPLWEPK